MADLVPSPSPARFWPVGLWLWADVRLSRAVQSVTASRRRPRASVAPGLRSLASAASSSVLPALAVPCAAGVALAVVLALRTFQEGAERVKLHSPGSADVSQLL